MYVPCPNCRGWMVGDGIPVGAAVLCPHCQQQFVMTEAILATGVQPESPGSVGTLGGGSALLSSAGPPPEQPLAKDKPEAPASASPEAQEPSVAAGAEVPSAAAPSSRAPTSSGPEAPPTPEPLPGKEAFAQSPGAPPWPTGSEAAGRQPLGLGAAPQPRAPAGPMPPMVSLPPGGLSPGMPLAGGGSLAAPGMGMPAPPVQMGFPPAPMAAPAREPPRPTVRRPVLSAEPLLIIGFSLMLAAVVIVVMLGYGGRPAAEKIGQPSPHAALTPPKGPVMKVSYDRRRGILYIENIDREWHEAELRINPDPADDEGGYRSPLGQVPRGRKKPVLLNQCLNASGKPFQGEIQRIVVVAKTADGTLRYVSEMGAAPR